MKKASDVVRKGQELEYSPQNERALFNPKNLFLKTLYENDDILIIDKPAGLTVHPGPAVRGDTLTDGLLFSHPLIREVGEDDRPGIVHRLDKETSGCILVAKTPEAYEYFKDSFQKRTVKKVYIALALGEMENSHGLIDTPIGKSKLDFRKRSAKDMLEPKEALTEYDVLEVLEGDVDKYSLIKVQLRTGRTHQIRVHFNTLHHPLMGDSLYGGKRVRIPGLNRHFLHAYSIEVRLLDGTWIEAVSPLPQDLSDILKKFKSKKVTDLIHGDR